MREKTNSNILKKLISWTLLITMIYTVFGTVYALASETKAIKLKYGSYAPRNSIDEPIFRYLEEVSKISGVQIQVEPYFVGTLAKPEDCLGAIGLGIYQIGWISPVFNSEKVPFATIPNATPVVSVPLKNSLMAAYEYTTTYPPALQEFEKAGVTYLFHSGAWYYDLISQKPVKSYEDIKGLRVRTFGYLAKAWAELGGSPISMPIPEVYSALQKGILDAVLTQPVSMHKSLHLSDVAKNFTKIRFGCLSVPVIMTTKTWEDLPKQVQSAMIQVAKQMPAVTDEMVSNAELAAIEDMKNSGITINEISEADMNKTKEVSKKIARVIVSDLESKGVSTAGTAMDLYLNAIEKNMRP
ncbi:MAG: TRAP transporter substrate-binding protein DctP [Desulfobacula sp.]|jgi:TRAP-type C4-dicarboxylate transport system substrate-binding protein